MQSFIIEILTVFILQEKYETSYAGKYKFGLKMYLDNDVKCNFLAIKQKTSNFLFSIIEKLNSLDVSNRLQYFNTKVTVFVKLCQHFLSFP